MSYAVLCHFQEFISSFSSGRVILLFQTFNTNEMCQLLFFLNKEKRREYQIQIKCYVLDSINCFVM
jgi:hypothetical protein